MDRLIALILKHRLVAVGAGLLIVFLGLLAWKGLEIEAYPDISDNEVNVITQLSGLPAEEMEQQVTIPIERALNTVPGVISKRSRTIFGLSKVSLIFNDRIDLYLARQLVLEKLREAELPEGAQPVLGPMTMAMGEIFRYVIEAPPDVPLERLTELQQYVIIPKLLQADGVVDVSNFGGLIRQFQVVVDPLRLEKFGLGIQNVAEAIAANNRNSGGGFLRVGVSQMNIRGLGRIRGADDIGNIVVDNRAGVPILIKDLAGIEIGHFPPNGVLGYWDKGRQASSDMNIEGIVLLKKFENPSRTMADVTDKIAELNGGLLPAGITVRPFYDRTELVRLTVHTVARTLLEGMLIVMVLLTILLGSWRAALISALAIPFALVFAFIVMYLLGIPANLLSLGAIDFGIIVDSTVVMVEALTRAISAARRRDAGCGIGPVIVRAAGQVQKQIFFTIFIIVLALLPMFTLQRVEGRLFSPMAWTLAFAILGSLIYAVTLGPVFASFLLARGREGKNHVWALIQGAYRRILPRLLLHPRKVSVLIGVIVLAGGVLATRLGTEYLPELDEGCVWVRVFLPPGISLEAARIYPDVLRGDIGRLEEVSGVMTQLGRTDDGTDPFGPNRIEVLVQLKQPYSSWASGRKKAEVVKLIQRRLEETLPGATFTITQPIIDMVTENATGSSSDLAVFLRGRDLESLRALGARILGVVKSIPGSSQAAIEQENKQTQVVVAVDRAAAARYGINVADVHQLLETAVGGLPVSSVWEEDRKFDIVLRFTREARNTPDSLAKILMPTKSGLRIPLSQVADIRLAEGQSVIFREDQERLITVKTNIRGRDQGGFAAELRHKIARQIEIPSGVHFSLGGQFENLQRSQKRLSLFVPLTLALIFLALLALFAYDAGHALIVMANVPLAAVGGIAALALRHMSLSISAGVGFVSLAGVSVMAGVLWLGHLNRTKSEGGALLDRVVEGSAVQFRPVFLVLIIAVIGLLPAALNAGVGSDIQRPLATVIVGGLLSSLLMTIWLTPILYFLYERRRERRPAAPRATDCIVE
jgi:cobalt-zinc-cadmium resistance protein CzcA